MANKILLNNEIYEITEGGLPCVITYCEKAGGSDFSITMVTGLFLTGSKILFLTAYPMAKENFFEQINGYESKVSYVTNEKDFNTDSQAIILESGNEKLLVKALETLDDINERVVFIKNIEIFSDTLFDSCLKLQKVILSGDIDKCVSSKEIINKQYKTIIAFKNPNIKLPFDIPDLEKYTGYMWSDKKVGIVAMKK